MAAVPLQEILSYVPVGYSVDDVNTNGQVLDKRQDCCDAAVAVVVAVMAENSDMVVISDSRVRPVLGVDVIAASQTGPTASMTLFWSSLTHYSPSPVFSSSRRPFPPPISSVTLGARVGTLYALLVSVDVPCSVAYIDRKARPTHCGPYNQSLHSNFHPTRGAGLVVDTRQPACHIRDLEAEDLVGQQKMKRRAAVCQEPGVGSQPACRWCADCLPADILLNHT